MHLRLENFDGPLDLLLHLIKVHEINIFNIPISLISEQFLGFLRQVPELDFHKAGEYLAMSAQLIEIKAQSLLPALKPSELNPQSLEEVPEEDPRRPLIEQLLEYEAIKDASLQLDQLKVLGRDVFPSGEFKRREGEFEDLMHPIKGNAFDLIIAFERALLKFAERMAAPKVRVHAQKITIQKKMLQLKKRFEVLPEATFRELSEDCESRYELIVTFMALLELWKVHQLVLRQEGILTPIHITRGARFEEDMPEIEGEESSGVSAGTTVAPKSPKRLQEKELDQA